MSKPAKAQGRFFSAAKVSVRAVPARPDKDTVLAKHKQENPEATNGAPPQ
jgi:hypothetical protein